MFIQVLLSVTAVPSSLLVPREGEEIQRERETRRPEKLELTFLMVTGAVDTESTKKKQNCHAHLNKLNK